mgnify:CR=1 FL=1
MEHNKPQKHSLDTLYYSTSRTLERGAYYGFRALILIYMIGETMKMETEEAVKIYGILTTSLIFSQIFGALLGDLVIGNKKSIIIGGVLQAFGAFTICISSKLGLYTGLFLIMLGNGLYNPNLMANFGKSYLNKTRLLDAGFTILYLAVNVGALFGVLFIGFIGKNLGYNFGFAMAGLFMLLSIVPIIFTKKIEVPILQKTSITRGVINITLAFLLVGFFWGIYEMSGTRIYDIQLQLSEISALGITKDMWNSLSSVFTIPVCIVAILIASFFYYSQFFKLLVGFVFGAMALGIILFIPEIPEENHAMTFLVSLLFLAISEIHIAPIIHSILTKYSNPKYLAILISLSFAPTRAFVAVAGIFNEQFYGHYNLGVKIGVTALMLISLGIVGYLILDKLLTRNNLNNTINTTS